MTSGLTVDEVIARLQAARARYGGDLPVLLPDEMPVAYVGVMEWAGPLGERMSALLRSEEGPVASARHAVIITDADEAAKQGPQNGGDG